MIRTVIFDMDGVIIDSEPIHQQLEWQMFHELGLEISEEEHRSFVGTSSNDMWSLIRSRHTLAKSPEELLLYGRQRYWEALDQQRVPLVLGVLELITLLHRQKYILQVASSATRPTVDKVLDFFQLQAFFTHRIGGDEVSKSKPEPEIFLNAARQSGSAPDNCLVIEDSANGVKAAKRAGMHCIGYANAGTGRQDLSGADIVVSDMRHITPELIQQLG
ncbi:MAG: HAD family phosphatase [Cyclobacteriaceae bacterium]|nr:HAD family phosphatase [Cyclobacteriaceae bacterium]